MFVEKNMYMNFGKEDTTIEVLMIRILSLELTEDFFFVLNFLLLHPLYYDLLMSKIV